MRLAKRLHMLETRLGVSDKPGLMIVFADDAGQWWSDGEAIDRATIDPRTQVIVICERPDGPQ